METRGTDRITRTTENITFPQKSNSRETTSSQTSKNNKIISNISISRPKYTEVYESIIHIILF